MSDVKQAHGIVSGRVQGVGFRYYVQDAARSLELRGEVRNLPDGRVEFTAEGDEEALKEFLRKVQRGPALARVADIQVDWRDAQGRFAAFQVTY